MAKRIDYEVKPTALGPDAHEELERLLETLHEHGILRLANDLAAANVQVAEVLASGFRKQGSLNAIQNLSALLMVLSRIEPAKFYRVASALADAVRAVGDAGEGASQTAPGISGAYAMLRDEELWQALNPLLVGFKVFADRLDRTSQDPITAFSGKPTSA